jgi:hypothetical protein
MFLRVAESGNVIDRVTGQLDGWLREKGWKASLDTSDFQVNGDRDLLTLHLMSAGSGHEFRARLTERTDTGVWRTQLTAKAPASGSSWVALQVANAEGRPTKVPRLAGYLLDALVTKDGLTEMTREPEAIGPKDVSLLIDQICDPHRHGLLFVAGSGQDGYTDFDSYVKDVAGWTKEVRGLAQVIVLTPNATDALWRELGPDHGVREWTLRTFYPGVDPAVRADALRHKFMTSRRLAGQERKATAAMLGNIARRHAAVRRLPDEYIQADRALRRFEDWLLVKSLTQHVPVPQQDRPAATAPATPVESTLGKTETAVVTAQPPLTEPASVIVPDTVEELLAGPKTTKTIPPAPDGTSAEVADVVLPAEAAPVTILSESAITGSSASVISDEIAALTEIAKEILGVPELSKDALTRIAEQVRQAQSITLAIAHLESQLAERELDLIEAQDEVAYYKDQFDTVQLEERERFQQATDLVDQNRYLKDRLIAAKDFEAAYGAIPEDAKTRYPDNFDELYQRLPELEASGVIFTGKAGKMLELDAQDTLGKLASMAWEALLVLADYVRARNAGDCDTSINGYLEKTPDRYRTLPPNKFAERESAATMQQFGGLREFTVPQDVDPAGHRSMQAHFKLGKLGMISPRMHVLDCWVNHGKVLVGYIGPHLRIVQTN